MKAGTHPKFPEQGTPQGGVVSSLLAQMARNSIEDIHKSIRYADDMMIILQPKDDGGKVLDRIKQFLADRGMNISPEKAKVTAWTDGFDF